MSNKENVEITIIANNELLEKQLRNSTLSDGAAVKELRTVTIPLSNNKIISIPYLKSEL
ncbi:hypothetical protein P4U03_30130 [Bacillus mycoides]|uniref:Uncharacterized protein n=6 Tax=root TaxID=1 RepID=I7I4E3_9CAUD|nr:MULTISPECIES: hypothetical protein [Bacteria]YP_006560745.1 hypothetical protein B605_gp57 [Staphylococcus phage SpaA1]YP_009099272.1 hypothetical protein Waukesha92_07 [Bacillus phage Waukesha92]YP_009218192.1 hypothetical protein XO28_0059 [Bacillus phage phi4J1]YP_009829868.1 hypothetical protein HWA83_gp57 [Bacillus phage BceA1]ALO79950.1 hypothetical protein XO29_0071 [Bacillus phage phiS58]MED1158361.1 hypothetical protein [Bacillus paranthracis]QCW20835.1 hypothetical protein WG69_